MPVPPRRTSLDPPTPANPEAAPSRAESQTRRMGSNPQPFVEAEPTALAGTLSVQVMFEDEDDDVLRPTPVTPPPRIIPPPQPKAAPPAAPPAAPSAPQQYEEGNVIDGKYRLVRIIGRGGMGAVWLAHNIPLDIDVAIKLIRRDRTAPESAGRLLQEARAVARLKHPSIVRVFDFGESEQGDPFIAMELLNGEPLSAIIRRKRCLEPAIAVQTLLPVASALASAHSKGIVHRDLKPDNILLCTDETGAVLPKVVDFGIAKLLSSDIDRQVTMAGEVLGSPDYMSPEQARGAENVGEATDVWTFSVLLYEALTGRRPFDGPNYNALIAAILTNDPVPLAEYGVNEPALWAILQRGLAKSPDGRWPTMRDLGTQLAGWVVERGVEDDVAGNPIARQWLMGATATRRLITVFPEGSGPAASGGVRPAAGAPPEPSKGASARPPAPSFPAISAAPMSAPWEQIEKPPRQGLWIVIGGALVALAAAAFLAREPISQLFGPAPAVSSASSAESAVNPPPPPPSAVDTSAPQPSASPASSPSGKTQRPSKVPGVKGKAPPVPTRINF